MKNYFLLFVSVIGSVFSVAGQATQTKGIVADKILAVVGDKVVLKSDIDNSIIDMQRQGVEVPENARCQVLEQAMGIKALVLQAEKDSLPVTDEDVETIIDNRIRSFIAQFGSKDELEKIAGKTIYQLKEDFKEPIRDQELAKAMRSKVVENVRITPNEVNAYFSKIPTDSLPYYESELEISQIVAYPKAHRDAEEYCVQQLKEYKEQIETGRKTFESVASLYTQDPGSKETGGYYEVNRYSKELDPIWLGKAFTLKEGQVSNPFKTRFGYHLMQLVSRNGDDAAVRHILLIPQVTSVEIRAELERLDSVRAKLIAGTMDFGEAVNKYSNDDEHKFTGGQLLGRDGSGYLTIDQLDKDMVLMLKNLKVGQYSQPTEFTDERGRKGVRIVYLKTRSEPHRENLKDDYNRIGQRALEEKKNQVLEQWFMKKVITYHIMVDDEFKSCPEMKKWLPENTASKN
ncbi:MAG: peptidylprolyl isomerase [Ferruginibacter sp.]|nr:peptidylprolyl isomerase [Ferruginibacter sp.]HQY10942.1 peptidylprolyl isomerase [Ferruginibacter sp.]